MAIGCLTTEVKKELEQFITKQPLPVQSKNAIIDYITKFPLCECIVTQTIIETKEKGVSTKRKKRAPSAYNKFMAECIGDRKEDWRGSHKDLFKHCAQIWKEYK